MPKLSSSCCNTSTTSRVRVFSGLHADDIYFLLCIILAPCFLMTSSILRLTCLHPSRPVANILSILLFAPPIWQRDSIIRTETLSSTPCCADTVAIDRKGSSCSSALLRSRMGSGFAEESSVGVILPLEIAASIEGMGTPASTRARLAALRHATSRAPSRLSTCRTMEIVDRGYKCVKR